jgi:metalloendopeptidase OMA1, mitochondrial
MKRLKWVVASLALAFFINACTTVEETGRRQLRLVSPSQEMQLGLSSFEELKKQMPISRDREANDAGLATVIGHEVAHASLHHGAERMSRAMAMQVGGQIVGAAASAADPGLQSALALAYGAGTKVGLELPHSRAQELEADRIGMRYMARAGYNPEEALRFWQRFSAQEAKGGSSMPGFLRTHPVDNVRLKELQRWLPEAKAQYRGR